MGLLLEADPSRERVEAYLLRSSCYVARREGSAIGVLALRQHSEELVELMNLAVAVEYRSSGIGTQILRHAIHIARERGASRLELGTGTFGPQLACYQKAGFRVQSIDRDFFLNNYSEPIYEQGLRHLDMLRLCIDLTCESVGTVQLNLSD